MATKQEKFDNDVVGRIITLEARMDTQKQATEDLVTAVGELTAILNKGKGALWAFLTIASLGAVVGTAISKAIAYIKAGV